MFDVTLVTKINLYVTKSGDAEKFRNAYKNALADAKADAKAICQKINDPEWQEYYSRETFSAGPDKIKLDFRGNSQIAKDGQKTFVQVSKSFDGVTVKVKTQVEADDLWALCPKHQTRLRDNHGTLYTTQTLN